jgi:hypothetical protein
LKGKASTIFGQQPEHIDLLMDIAKYSLSKYFSNCFLKSSVIVSS